MTENNPPNTGRVSPARYVAWEVIAAVRESDAYANLLLPIRIERARLTPSDAAFATELTYGTLRMQGYYDRVIALAANRDVRSIDPPLRDVLRLGTHQLLATRVAQHAAVNESVDLARRVGSRSATGFVNGVLRTVSRSSPEQWHNRVIDEAESADDARAAITSHPAWIVRAFAASLHVQGRDDELDELLASNNKPPRVNLIALPGIAAVPDDADRNRFSPYGFTSPAGDPHGVLAGAHGRIRVQDEGSQLAALALINARKVGAGERWLDLCAGPGGKAAVLAVVAKTNGVTLVANEVVPARADLVRSALRELDPTVTVWERDGTGIGLTDPQSFDRILLDAPCSGLGALRRRPEARWRKTLRDIAELTRLQEQLIDSAVLALKPGGILAYVTCSPHVAETRNVVAAACARHAGSVELIDAVPIVQALSREPLDLAQEKTFVQLWPHRHETDAMFICLLRRTVTPHRNQ